MPLPAPVLVAEAATFTWGCMLLRHRRFDPDRVGLVLAAVLSGLVLILLLALSPAEIAIDPCALDPAGIWPIEP